MAPKHKILCIFPVFILAIGAVLPSGCGGSGSSGSTTTPTAATPTFSPATGTYTTAQSVNLSDATSGATIYYTSDGTTPTTSSTKYTAAISVSSTETIKAIAAASGYTNSSVASAVYTISTIPTAATPTFSPAAGTYTTAQTVTLSDATSGATIYYTTDGTTPTTSSTKYTAAISVSSTETIQAIAVASGYTNSTAASAAYTISTTATATVLGADVGWLTQLESLGYTWTDTTGTSGSALQILKDHGVNTIRIRTFVNPTITTGVLGVGDLDQAGSIALAQRANSMGFKIVIDFHYSDTWADPGHQAIPAAWASDSYAQLQTDVYNYTFNFMTALAADGIYPQYVQVGNEINTGMLWPIGAVGATTVNGNDFTQVTGLINSGYSAVKAVSSTSQVVIHIAGISNLSDFEWFFDGLKDAGANFDVIGASYYDGPGNITTVATNLNTLAARYSKPVLISEIGYSYSDPTDAYTDVHGAIQAMNAVPNNMGLGVIYWEPEAPDDAATVNYALGAVTEGSGKVLQFTTAITAF